MKAPGFWYAPPGPLAWGLAPLSLLWRLGSWWRRVRARPHRAGVPVICVGNLTAGGAGKTPMVGELLRLLAGHDPHVVMRGHGGRLRGPHQVSLDRDSHLDVGDEALIHAALAPTWVARNRAAGAQAAVAAGAGCLILDDGLQNPSLAHDLRMVLVDAGQGFGNGFIIPAGPLREPVMAGLAHSDLTVLVGEAAVRARALERWPALARTDPLPARIAPVATGLPLQGTPVVAFAGIGRPQKFFDTLRALGADLRLAEGFADHYAYPPAVLDRLIKRARAEGALLVTTEKDAVRLGPKHRREVLVLPVGLVIEDRARLEAKLAALGLG
ncbi:MAG: tetraacyldisaccharide 4'-kinase [Pseudomonadota bacterium]